MYNLVTSSNVDSCSSQIARKSALCSSCVYIFTCHVFSTHVRIRVSPVTSVCWHDMRIWIWWIWDHFSGQTAGFHVFLNGSIDSGHRIYSEMISVKMSTCWSHHHSVSNSYKISSLIISEFLTIWYILARITLGMTMN